MFWHLFSFTSAPKPKPTVPHLRVSLSPPQVRLNPAESSDVLKRWAEHLCSPQVNQKSKAILVLLTLGCFHKVGEMLLRWVLHSCPTG